MFEFTCPSTSRHAGVVRGAGVADWVSTLAGADVAGLDDVERMGLLRGLEELTCAAQGLQAEVAAVHDGARRAEDAERGVPAERRGRGVAAEIALARRESPHRGQRHLSLATALARELPHTHAALRSGRITEWKAVLVDRETSCLDVPERGEVDRALAGDPTRLEAMGDQELAGEARTLAYRLDPVAFVERRRRAESDRRVTLRPAPDVMSQLSALLPVKDGVAVYAALKQAADSARAAGDERGRSQVMADELVQRVAGVSTSSTDKNGHPTDKNGHPTDRIGHPTDKRGHPTNQTAVPVMINLIVSDQVLLGDSDEPGYVEGYGPVPADLVREIATEAGIAGTAWLRRLYERPETGDLVAMDSTARIFPSKLAELIRLRDRTCRTPWCDAPIRHIDHAKAAVDGGETSAANGQGLCVACNIAKQAHGWSARPRPGPTHTVSTTTPTGHTYASSAPPATATRPSPYPIDLFWPAA